MYVEILHELTCFVRLDTSLASGLSPVQADNPWSNYFIPPTLISEDLPYLEIFHAVLKYAVSCKGGLLLSYMFFFQMKMITRRCSQRIRIISRFMKMSL